MTRAITPLLDLVALPRLVLVMRRERPDVVHAHTPKGGLLGMIAATLAGVPVRIYHLRGLRLMGAEGATRTLLAALERVSCALATEVLCVSHSVRSIVVEQGLCPAPKIRVLLEGSGQGVDGLGRFDPSRVSDSDAAAARAELGVPPEALLFGFVGRLVREKGIEELAQAWQRVRIELPDAHLLLVGPAEPHDPIAIEHHRALEADPRVTMIGFSEDTPRLYAAMDVVVLPTYREGFPNVPLEAASMGKPVIATRVPGCIDAVEEGVTGLLVEARDVATLTEAMVLYGRDRELRRAHGANGRARVVRSFLREAIWDAIAERYRSLAGSDAEPSRGGGARC